MTYPHLISSISPVPTATCFPEEPFSNNIKPEWEKQWDFNKEKKLDQWFSMNISSWKGQNSTDLLKLSFQDEHC